VFNRTIAYRDVLQIFVFHCAANPCQINLHQKLNCYAAYALPLTREDVDAALATMTPDVAWPKAFEGGSAMDIKKSALSGRQWSESIRTWRQFLSLEDARRI